MTGRAIAESQWPAEPGARALYRAVGAACGHRGGEFAERVDAGLAAALSFLAADLDLARDLAVLGDDPQALAAQRRWVARFADLLRGVTADLPGTTPGPRFREAFLIEAIRFQIGRRVLVGEAARLPQLRPELLGVVLVYYREEKPGSRAPAERAGSR